MLPRNKKELSAYILLQRIVRAELAEESPVEFNNQVRRGNIEVWEKEYFELLESTTDIRRCPGCGSENLHQFRLHHIHCKDCKEDFDKDCD